MDTILIGAALIAATELVKALKDKDGDKVIKIIAAPIIGGLAGFFQLAGLDITSGIIAGLGAAGAYKAAKVIRN